MKRITAAAGLYWLCLGWGSHDIMAYEWKAGDGHRSAAIAVSRTGKPGFTLLAPDATGILFTNSLAQDRHLTNQILLNGSGLAAGDVDGDGWCDLYFCGLDAPNRLYRNLGQWKFADITASAGVGCTNLDATGAVLADLDGDRDLDLIVNSVGAGTHIYLNDGKGHFTESADAPLNSGMGGMSLALADIDGDGDLDVYVTNYRTVTIRDQPNTVFTFGRTNGQAVLTKIDDRPITEPDLVNRFNYTITMREGGATFAHDENGEADVLYRNEGGRLRPVSFTDGSFLDEAGKPLTKPPFDWGLSVMFRDINGDGAPDIYICNDFKSPDRIWINDGRGKFRALAPLALRQTSLSSMGVDFADLNRDGHDDFLVVDMLSRNHQRRHSQRIDIKPEPSGIGQIENRPQYPRNTLFLNRGDGTYAEIAQLSGLEATEWSWTPIFLDVDLDGYEDLLVSNGFERDGMNVDILQRLEAMKREIKFKHEQQKPAPEQLERLPPQQRQQLLREQRQRLTREQLHLRKIFPRLDTANLAFRNLGNLKFQDQSAEWAFNTPGIAQGMALADLDNDGDHDVVVNNFNGPAGLYRNDCPAPRLAVRLQGQAPNTQGIGAKIEVSGGPVTQSQEMISGGRYLSGDDSMRVFAAGPGDMTVEVTWRSGRRSVVRGAKANTVCEISEAKAEVEGPKPKVQRKLEAPLFKDVSDLLKHSHHEEPFDDFESQRLLPHRLSQGGPGVAWFDLDGDGWEDLLIGSGRGGTLAAYRNDGRGAFKAMQDAPLGQAVMRDQTTILGWRKPDGKTVVLAGSANYEDGLSTPRGPGKGTGGGVRQYDLGASRVDDSLPDQASSTGPMALADIDADGDLDLFVGGRVIPKRYGEPASSLLFRNDGGRWVPDSENGKRFANLAMVSGCVFSDVDGDGDADLILACDLGPVRVFRNAGGLFTEATVELGLNGHHGFWNGVTSGDFDGDGRLDIVASNWGRNSRFESFRAAPLRIFHGDADGDGTFEVLEAYVDPVTSRVLPGQPFHLISAALPSVAERLGTHASYAGKDLNEIYGLGLKGLKERQVNCLESTLFLNRGDRFEARPLPIEAQMSPAFAVCVGDVNGDGMEDIFLSQNFFATHPDTSRYDAGRALWLKGDGNGDFTAVAGQDSGIRVYGEQRGAALCDFDADGRVDLAVTQNGQQTRLYQNVLAPPGLRVRLQGPSGNPHGVGATIRLLGAGKKGPAREVHAGSGYWSQDGAVQVLARVEGVSQVWVRWPDGKATTSDLPGNARDLMVSHDGRIQVLR